MRATYLPPKVPETICSDEPIKTSYSQQITNNLNFGEPKLNSQMNQSIIEYYGNLGNINSIIYHQYEEFAMLFIVVSTKCPEPGWYKKMIPVQPWREKKVYGGVLCLFLSSLHKRSFRRVGRGEFNAAG